MSSASLFDRGVPCRRGQTRFISLPNCGHRNPMHPRCRHSTTDSNSALDVDGPTRYARRHSQRKCVAERGGRSWRPTGSQRNAFLHAQASDSFPVGGLPPHAHVPSRNRPHLIDWCIALEPVLGHACTLPPNHEAAFLGVFALGFILVALLKSRSSKCGHRFGLARARPGRRSGIAQRGLELTNCDAGTRSDVVGATQFTSSAGQTTGEALWEEVPLEGGEKRKWDGQEGSSHSGLHYAGPGSSHGAGGQHSHNFFPSPGTSMFINAPQVDVDNFARPEPPELRWECPFEVGPPDGCPFRGKDFKGFRFISELHNHLNGKHNLLYCHNCWQKFTAGSKWKDHVTEPGERMLSQPDTLLCGWPSGTWPQPNVLDSYVNIVNTRMEESGHQRWVLIFLALFPQCVGRTPSPYYNAAEETARRRLRMLRGGSGGSMQRPSPSILPSLPADGVALNLPHPTNAANLAPAFVALRGQNSAGHWQYREQTGPQATYAASEGSSQVLSQPARMSFHNSGYAVSNNSSQLPLQPTRAHFPSDGGRGLHGEAMNRPLNNSFSSTDASVRIPGPVADDVPFDEFFDMNRFLGSSSATISDSDVGNPWSQDLNDRAAQLSDSEPLSGNDVGAHTDPAMNDWDRSTDFGNTSFSGAHAEMLTEVQAMDPMTSSQNLARDADNTIIRPQATNDSPIVARPHTTTPARAQRARPPSSSDITSAAASIAAANAAVAQARQVVDQMYVAVRRASMALAGRFGLQPLPDNPLRPREVLDGMSRQEFVRLVSESFDRVRELTAMERPSFDEA